MGKINIFLNKEKWKREWKQGMKKDIKVGIEALHLFQHAK